MVSEEAFLKGETEVYDLHIYSILDYQLSVLPLLYIKLGLSLVLPIVE